MIENPNKSMSEVKRKVTKADWLVKLETLLEDKRLEFLTIADQVRESDIPSLPVYLSHLGSAGAELVQYALLHSKARLLPEKNYQFYEDRNHLWIEMRPEQEGESLDYMV